MRIVFLLFFVFLYSSEKVFVACEGNYYQSNGSIWTISDEQVYDYSDNPLGQVVQSLLVHEDQLFVAVNVPGNIQVFDITDAGLVPAHFVDTQYSGPREMLVVGDYLYFTNWYTADIKKLNLSTWEIESEIVMPGLPEDIVMHDGNIYVSIIMNNDWTDGNLIVSVDLNSDTIIETYDVGSGPGDLLVHEEELFVARTYYDENWNAFYGTSKIKNDGQIIMNNYGAGLACGGSVHSLNGSVYRSYNGGIALLDQDLNILEDTRIGNFNFSDVYSVKTIGDNIYFGLSDFEAPDEVVVLNSDGVEVNRYSVGAIPGDFAVWNSCLNNGDVNSDTILNITDIVTVVYYVLDEADYLCSADINSDGAMDVLDIVDMVQQILGIDSFRGAVNWLHHHFPELKVNERIKKLHNSARKHLK